MAPGVYKSFRKALKRNNDKFNEFNAEEELSIIDNDMTDEYIDKLLVDDMDWNGNLRKVLEVTRKDLEREVYQAMEAFVHNLNTLHARAGSQLPFSSINLGTDISNAGRMVTKNLLLAMEAGLGHGETCIFPIVIFKVKEGVNYNPEDPNYDLLQLSYRVTGKRLFPNYLFLDSPFNLQYYKPGHPETEVATMGE